MRVFNDSQERDKRYEILIEFHKEALSYNLHKRGRSKGRFNPLNLDWAAGACFHDLLGRQTLKNWYALCTNMPANMKPGSNFSSKS